MSTTLPADVQHFYRRARNHATVHQELKFGGLTIAVMAALVWVVGPMAVLKKDHSAFEWILLSVAAALGVSGVYRVWAQGIWPMIADYSFGSRIEVQQRELIWWRGAGDVRQHRISLDDIAYVKRVKGPEVDELTLHHRDGRKLDFDARCVVDKSRWAEAVVAAFPSIALVTE